ncbi:aminotransferase class V-fold PLP-dependent enzyme [Sphingomonas sp. PB2P19]|uniref:aminotransferase class V-fold PLP-dependent enzyme n=1 Tax=Sphingomonas rhamnosi TaxID=3096156 RepID=UPI002FC96CAD
MSGIVAATLDRRLFLTGAAAVAAVPASAFPRPAATQDEAFWKGVASQYDVTREVIQLENGNWGMMARPVLQAYERNLERVNRDTSYYTRRGMMKDWMAARDALAATVRVPAEEIAFTRNATEALKALILGYNALTPGDAVLYADLDYDSMQACMDSLKAHRGVSVIKIALPQPATRQSLIDTYASAMEANPRLKLILLTHLSHRTGLVLPVREIAAMARARGIATIVDAAHSWCQLDMTLADLDCDYVGINCHKWLGAPLGVGAIHIRQGALAAIDCDPANPASDRDTINARIHTGTVDFAAPLTIPAALAFQNTIGSKRRANRLAALRNRWVDQVRPFAGIEILTQDDAALHGGITSFRFKGRTSAADNIAVAKRLLEEFRIFTVYRDGPAAGACVRVTPALFNTMADMDALAAALKIIGQ